MAWTRAALALVAAGAVALALVSGGSPADPRTPAGLPGMPPPFLGTAVVGDGGLTAAIDAYGDVVDLRAGPAGAPLIENPATRQAAGSVAAGTGIAPRVHWTNANYWRGYGPVNSSRSRRGGEPLWRADSVAQRYLPGTNVARTVARFGPVRVVVVYAADGGRLACLTSVRAPRDAQARISIAVADRRAADRLHCDDRVARRIVRGAARADRRWLSRARALGPGAPAWAGAMYRRSLLTLRALTDRRTGAVAAGARDGWAYVWPRDAATAALAFAAAGYEREAHRVARFLTGLDLGAAARFQGDGTPVTGRAAQGDAAGWVAAAARAAGLPLHPPRPGAHASRLPRSGTRGPRPSRLSALPSPGRADYQESGAGDFIGNALATASLPGPRIEAAFGVPGGLVRRAGDPASGLDSAAAWAVQPFARPSLFPAARRTMLRLAARGTRFGITPGAGWDGADPWMAPTAWTAWSLATLAERERRLRRRAPSRAPVGRARSVGNASAAARDRRAALSLLTDLRRAATPAGALPERVDADTGVPTSTTPLAWSHAFAILALRQLWP